MRISDVADEVGVPVSTIRYYEKRSIIGKPGRNGRNRDYSEQDVRAIKFVRDARSLGLPLSDISALVQNSWDKGEMAKVAAGHRETVRERIQTLQRVDEVLSVLETCTCIGFADCRLSINDGKCDD